MASREWTAAQSPDGRTRLTVKITPSASSLKVHAWNLSGGAGGGHRGMVITSLAVLNLPVGTKATAATVTSMTGPYYIQQGTVSPAKWTVTDQNEDDGGTLRLAKPTGHTHNHGHASNCIGNAPRLDGGATSLWASRTCGSAWTTGGSSLKGYAVEIIVPMSQTFDPAAVQLEVTTVDETGAVDTFTVA